MAISGRNNVSLAYCGYHSVLKAYYIGGSWHMLVLSVVLLN